MKPLSVTSILLALIWSLSVESMEVSGSAGVTYRHYWDDPQFLEQQAGDTTEFVAEPEASGQIGDKFKIRFRGFLREGFNTDVRDHTDIRELLITFRQGPVDVSLGIGKIFWGVTESLHLVDVINQVDLIEDILEEEKLGQPMASVAAVSDFGNVSLYWLPYFREREYPELDQRFRYPISWNLDDPIYLDDRHNHHRDYALRYSNTWDEVDFGLSFFDGVGRRPWFLGFSGDVRPIYARERQVGIDLQYTVDAWLIKHESIYNKNTFDNYIATVNGFEYTFFQIFEGDFDLGVLIEHLYNNKDRVLKDIFNNDIFAGVRVSFNDVQSSSLLAGVIYDPETQEGIVKFESAKRIGQDWTISINAIHMLNPKFDFQSFSNDSFIEACILYHF